MVCSCLLNKGVIYMSNGKPKVVLSLQNEYNDIEFSLYRTINIIAGEKSASGKSAMSGAILDARDSGNLFISGYLGSELVSYAVEEFSPNLSNLSFSSDRMLFIVDDVVPEIYAPVVLEICKKSPNAVFLIISRDIRGCPLSCFVDSVYRVIHDESANKDVYRLLRLTDIYERVNFLERSGGQISECIIEGHEGNAEHSFYKNLFEVVHCAEGRFNVSKHISKLKQSSALVIVDSCAYGFCI